MLVVLFGNPPRGWLGGWLQEVFGIHLIFTWQGAVVAAAVVAFPLVFKPARAAFEAVDGHLEQAAHKVAPEFATFLTRHISDTVKSWDARDMSQQIELNIGKDLQYIRINGTLVGGLVADEAG